jgi:porphobilinogen synthase
MSFPATRLRRLRRTPTLRRLFRETRLSVDSLVQPLFVRDEEHARREIASLPGQFQLGIEEAAAEAAELYALGVPAVLLFGLPRFKDETAKQALAEDGVIPRAIGAIKEKAPEIVVITDVCLCEYMSHGHCGVLGKDGDVLNDETLDLLARMAVVHAAAGAEIVAPSAMMDGQVGAIRAALDEEGFAGTAILAYAAKFASAFYGPFREAAGSAPQSGDRKGYQLDPANAREAEREIALDVEEGADIVMVKPALAYLDVLREARARLDLPLAAYNVSGEYAMLKAAAKNGWLDEQACALEILTAIKRAGADVIITYWAKEAARWLAK